MKKCHQKIIIMIIIFKNRHTPLVDKLPVASPHWSIPSRTSSCVCRYSTEHYAKGTRLYGLGTLATPGK